MKKCYRLSLDFEIEIKDFASIPVLRGEWSKSTTPQYIIERLKCARELLAKMLEHQEVLDAYLQCRILADLEANCISLEDIAERIGIESSEKEILKPLLKELSAETIVHFIDAGWDEDTYSATVPLADAFKENMIGVELKEIESD